ncbi:hypothetical protein MKY09_11625 [Psychrobacillus sp. FSL K6-4046]|uniref:hypothetical protein n=1 Tax=Psychrobacillus sp. FSL K6-4046 TaxID=2921550 RepID=UPI0031599D2E
MKKFSLLLFILVFLLACEEKNTIENSSKVESDNFIFIKEEDIEVPEGAYLAENITEDLTGDGIEDEIILYISPPPIIAETGEFLWDDSHLWQLILIDQGKKYPLYNDSVRGVLDFWIAENEGKKELVLFNSGQHLMLYKYNYDKEKFIRNELFYEKLIINQSFSQW